MFDRHIEILRKIEQRRWVKFLLGIWAVVAIYDLLLSQFIPEEFSTKAPKAWKIAMITGGWVPWLGWLLILAAILLAASLEYALRVTQRHRRDSVDNTGGTVDLKQEASLMLSNVRLAETMVETGQSIHEHIGHEYGNQHGSYEPGVSALIALQSQEFVNNYFTKYSAKVISQHDEARLRGFADPELTLLYKKPKTLEQIRAIAFRLCALGETIKVSPLSAIRGEAKVSHRIE